MDLVPLKKTILDEGHRLSRSVHSFFRAVRVFLFRCG
jgi:hypothetical protein